ncbi:uncharacterized protein N7498_009334 [Penicillium cinerascens]|uniref:Clr5 domain-containing protein n=1 Tax=Penicillium cinerascens TaxID=70096 RepID=A0A9W9J4D9_9EURO|nr:uncharacterized protein N7498_009334 [Penicillium cinerascens]KAJ5190349.1 hypothetical protein N7498_009334 [Penicillium cinerascens]
MKTSISSCAWEKKKPLINRLYVEEEWPLKHVLKQIRSDDFNPSETQLRSRLRKWRAIKPSRKTRRPRGCDSGDDDSEKDENASPATPPHNDGPSPAAMQTSTGWDCSGLPAGALLDVHSQPMDQKWNASAAQLLTPSPSMDHVRVSNRSHAAHDLNMPATSFEQPARTSPVAEGLIMNTTSAPMSSSPGYPVYPGQCVLPPGSTTNPPMAAWSPCPMSPDLGLDPTLDPEWWYSMAFEAPDAPPGVPHSASHHQEYIPVAVPPPSSAYPPELAHYGGYEPRKHIPPHWPHPASMVPPMVHHPRAGY